MPTVPKLVGLTQSAAEAELLKAGLKSKIGQKVSSPSTAVDLVCNTQPLAGQEAGEDLTVQLDISTGPASGKVPELAGLTRTSAESALKAAGFEVGKAHQVVTSDIAPGGVISSSPPFGSSANSGSKIDLNVAMSKKADWTDWVLPIIFTFLGVLLFVAIIYAIFWQKNFLPTLANKEVARGLITFLIAITTVGIAVILALSTVILKGGEEDDKRFDRGKQVLSTLIGLLGTIVGFYYGATIESKDQPLVAPTVVTTTLPDGLVNQAYKGAVTASGGKVPLTWSVEPKLPEALALDPNTGVIEGTPTKPQSKGRFTFTVQDGSEPPISKESILTLEIK